MHNFDYREIKQFDSPSEFKSLLIWIEDRLKLNELKQVPVKFPYAGATTLREKWYLQVDNGHIWRLVWPDFPFTGLFEQVE